MCLPPKANNDCKLTSDLFIISQLHETIKQLKIENIKMKKIIKDLQKLEIIY